ncbi:hypothetical protein HPB48_013406 [Haemaphysalis longicornis]|uniref:Uncharacterized protein n=1 Tax=Haemaphysalis longicornis TaxID=44386 RepID=A0A9J6GJ30_HAELO|nr:hypothetical protein HPB48_013406 [Haemaphysalis longicornis]
MPAKVRYRCDARPGRHSWPCVGWDGPALRKQQGSPPLAVPKDGVVWAPGAEGPPAGLQPLLLPVLASVGGQHTEALRSVLLACQPADSKDRLVRQGGQQLSRAGGAGAPGGGGLVVQLVPSSGQDHFHLEEAADTQSVLSPLRPEGLQHPYARLFVSYFVVFCNFLVFAEDPISHSRSESEIPVFGNVFSFMCTKYPPEWGWRAAKTLLWLLALLWGLVCGKLFIHHFLLRNLLRLKMFREEQGTWMIMLLTALLFVYALSLVYNTLLLSGTPAPRGLPHQRPDGRHQRLLHEGGRLRDLARGLPHRPGWHFIEGNTSQHFSHHHHQVWQAPVGVTDMMLQDELYPGWAPSLRAFWQRHGRTRIVVFWAVALLLSALVVSLIVSDHISWDYLNREFVATTELSRAFLASFILVMDLLIVMQLAPLPDGRRTGTSPTLVCDLNIKLPGLSAASFSALLPKYETSLLLQGSGSNYGIIVVVMLLDLNMWKNQIFYQPADYGQYTTADHKVRTVLSPATLATGNRTLWTLQYRQSELNPATNRSLAEDDIMMNSRYLGYPLSVKGLAFLPSLLGFAMFGALTYMYGRFPPKTDATSGRSVAALVPLQLAAGLRGRPPGHRPPPGWWSAGTPSAGLATRATTSDQLAAAKGAPPR